MNKYFKITCPWCGGKILLNDGICVDEAMDWEGGTRKVYFHCEDCGGESRADICFDITNIGVYGMKRTF